MAFRKLHARFASVLPRIVRHARVIFRSIKCWHTKEDKIAEVVDHCWVWVRRLHKRHRQWWKFVSRLADFAARAVRSGRKIAGMTVRDVLSEINQARKGYCICKLPDFSPPGAGLEVAQWLTEKRLPKCGNALKPEWSEKNVMALIHRPIYRGHDEYRVTVVKKQFRTGKHPQVRNAPDQILTRSMPHLRIVEDWLWHAANQAIADRKLCDPAPRGREHPLAGMPRSSRGPLSEIFFCGACQTGKMYQEGRIEGGYRCAEAPKGRCWNKATADRDWTHAQIGQVIRDRLLHLDGVVEVILDELPRRLADAGPLHAKLVELQARETQLLAARQRLLLAIENARQPLEILVERLREVEEELACVRGAIEQVKAQLAHRTALPSRAVASTLHRRTASI